MNTEPLEHIGVFGYSMQLCRQLILELMLRGAFAPHPKKEQPYLDAELRLLLSDPDHIQRYIEGERIRYRNHAHDSAKRLVYCEAYFARENNNETI